MKGLALNINGQIVKAGGYAGVVMSNKDSCLRISLIGCDKEYSYTYLSRNLRIGDNIIVAYEDIAEPDLLSPVNIIDHRNPEELKRCALEEYYRLRQELIEEGLL